MPQQENTGSSEPLLTNRLYDKLKFGVMIVMPAVSTLYFTLGAIWGLPAIEQVIGTIAALSTFFGVLLGLSNRSYNASDARFDGSVKYSFGDDGKIVYSIELDDDPAELFNKEEVAFNIKPADEGSQ